MASADTLVYFGDLRPVAAAAAGALRTGGLLIFTVEKAGSADPEGRGFFLQPHGRYCHTEDYVRRTLAEAGLSVCAKWRPASCGNGNGPTGSGHRGVGVASRGRIGPLRVFHYPCRVNRPEIAAYEEVARNFTRAATTI